MKRSITNRMSRKKKKADKVILSKRDLRKEVRRLQHRIDNPLRAPWMEFLTPDIDARVKVHKFPSLTTFTVAIDIPTRKLLPPLGNFTDSDLALWEAKTELLAFIDGSITQRMDLYSEELRRPQ